VHQAKGLEFHTVFVIWLTDGGCFRVIARSIPATALEEERPSVLCGHHTRARDELYLAYPQMRLSGGIWRCFSKDPRVFSREIPNGARGRLASEKTMTKIERRMTRGKPKCSNENRTRSIPSSFGLRHYFVIRLPRCSQAKPGHSLFVTFPANEHLPQRKR